MIADAHKSRFQEAKRLDMGSAVLQAGRIADIQDRGLRQRNVHIWAVASCNGSISLCSWNRY
jgi:hypothetical protein